LPRGGLERTLVFGQLEIHRLAQPVSFGLASGTPSQQPFGRIRPGEGLE
jgi:hypothetical protein